ncbi:UDP-glucose 4-epimerase, putative [Eimeria brunetti]|uniref:UDP-glucose 4-epimerase n=1 Tax=Eimeria brunetti TaxID=51314 RepID=U6LUR2_9EIME|nr:UDP-glucose 4-epimerase, putative [Eimeria brunetti]
MVLLVHPHLSQEFPTSRVALAFHRTGGLGYIGSHTVVQLIEAGYDVLVADNLSNASPVVEDRIRKITNATAEQLRLDLKDKQKTLQLFKDERIDAVIHYAALKAVGESVEKPLSYYENNDVYNADNSWKISILRYFNPVGAHPSGLIGESPDQPNNLLPVIQHVAVGRLKCLQVYGNDWDTPDGTGVRDYLHVDDLASGHLAAVKKLRPGDLACVVADPTLAENDFNWKATRTIESGGLSLRLEVAVKQPSRLCMTNLALPFIPFSCLFFICRRQCI